MAEFTVQNESDTARLAAVVGRFLQGVDCLTLTGDLGAGKTTFMRYLIASLSDQPVTVISPSFLLMQEYDVWVSENSAGSHPTEQGEAPASKNAGAGQRGGGSEAMGARPPSSKTKTKLWHLDGYRLKDETEIPELGLDEILQNGMVAVEWPERFAGYLPQDRLEMRFTLLDGTRRTITINGEGKHANTAARISEKFHD